MIQGQTNVEDKINLAEPKMYAVIIHNDDITTMDFVVQILNRVFDKTLDEANELMLDVHKKGSGLAGVYIKDIAITKKNQADLLSLEYGYPLKITVEECEK